MSGLSSYKIRSYNNNDPRYNIHISDSYDLIKEIYPFHIQKVCDKKTNNVSNFNGIDNFCGDNCMCSECSLRIYNKAEDTISWKDTGGRLVNLTPNTIYDRTRIRKLEHPNIDIDRSPDTSLYNLDNIKKYDENIIEHYDNYNNNGNNNCKDLKILIVGFFLLYLFVKYITTKE